MSRPSRTAVLSLLLALAAGLLVCRSLASHPESRVALAAVDARSLTALSGQRPSSAGELWEQLKAMGVGAILLHEERLSELAARGEVLHFTRAEVAKWRAAGLTSAGGALRGDALWVKDPKVLARVEGALAAQGMDVSTSSVAGWRTIDLPDGFDPVRVPAGFDPDAVAAATAAGLLPIAVTSAAVVPVAGQSLWVRTLPVSARREEVLRAAFGRPRRLLILRPGAGQGLEATLDSLRADLRVLRETGLPSTLPEPASPPASRTRAFRLFLIWALALGGPLLALRSALAVSRWVRLRTASWPLAVQAAPVPEVLAGVLASAATAAAAGLLVAAVAPAGWRDGSAHVWTLWAWCAPLTVAALALFASEPGSRWGLSEPLTLRRLLTLALFVSAAALLLAPRASLRASDLWEVFDRFSAVSGALWWWPWRWREVLVGVPALVAALVLIESRPKGWLLLALLAPSGFLAAVGGSGAPLGAAVAQGCAAHLLGAVLGAGLAAALALIDRWAQGPRRDRTIDLETGS